MNKYIITNINRFKNEQYQFSEVELNDVIEIIKDKYPRINNGGCAVFAKAMHDVTSIPYVLIIDTDLTDEDPPIHVMLRLPDGRLMDGNGIYSEEQVIGYYTDNDIDIELLDDDGMLLDIYYDELGEGVFTTCHKKDYSEILKIIKDIIIL